MPVENKKESSAKEALSRFSGALAALETSIDGYLDGNRAIQDAETEVQQVNADRGQLAEKLDKSEARSARLESINKEVSRRLVDAMESIRAVIDAKPG